MKIRVGLFLAMASLGFLLAGCEDSTTTQTVLGDFNEQSKDVQKNLVEHAKNFKREDYYGTWWYSDKEGGQDSAEVTLKIDKDYVEDVNTGIKVKYKFNKKTREIVVETNELSQLFDEDLSDGYIVYTFIDESDKNSLSVMGHYVNSNGDKVPLIGGYSRTESDNENNNESFGYDNQSTESSEVFQESIEVEAESSTEEESDEVSSNESVSLTKMDIFDVMGNETNTISQLTTLQQTAVTQAMIDNGYSSDDIDKGYFLAFTDNERNVVVSGIYDSNNILEKIFMINLDSLKVTDVYIPSNLDTSNFDQSQSSTSKSTMDSYNPEGNPMNGVWKANKTPLTFTITAESATISHGNEIYDLTNPLINGNTVEYVSNFKIGDSAPIYMVKLEYVDSYNSIARLYLSDERVITEYITKE